MVDEAADAGEPFRPRHDLPITHEIDRCVGGNLLRDEACAAAERLVNDETAARIRSGG